MADTPATDSASARASLAQKPFDRLSLALLVSSAGCTLDAGPKLALIALVQHYNDRTGQCFPSMKTIARLSGNISEKQARRHVNALIALGLVTSVPRAGRSCCYRFHVAAIQALACHARGADTGCRPGRSGRDQRRRPRRPGAARPLRGRPGAAPVRRPHRRPSRRPDPPGCPAADRDAAPPGPDRCRRQHRHRLGLHRRGPLHRRRGSRPRHHR